MYKLKNVGASNVTFSKPKLKILQGKKEILLKLVIATTNTLTRKDVKLMDLKGPKLNFVIMQRNHFKGASLSFMHKAI